MYSGAACCGGSVNNQSGYSWELLVRVSEGIVCQGILGNCSNVISDHSWVANQCDSNKRDWSLVSLVPLVGGDIFRILLNRNTELN